MRALAAFFVGCLFFAYAFVHRVAPSVMTEDLMRDFAVGGSALGSLSAMYFYAYVALQIPVGILMDRFGPRRLMSIALLVCGCASVGMATGDSLLAASISRALIGASVAFAFVGTLTILTFWFVPARFALFAGVLQSTGMLGAMLGQAPMRIAVEQLSWRGAVAALAVLAFVLAALAWLVVPKRSEKDRQREPATSQKGTVGQLLRKRDNWLCAVVGFGLAAPLLGFAALWSVPWLSSVRGFGHTQSAAIASMVFMGWLVGAPLSGWISDRIGRRKPVILFGGLLSIAAFVAVLTIDSNNVVLLSALFFLNGLGGCTMIVCFSIMREYNEGANTSAALGMMNTFVVGSGAVMQPLIGLLLDSQWQGSLIDGARVYDASAYLMAFQILVLVNALAIGCCLMLRETYCLGID